MRCTTNPYRVPTAVRFRKPDRLWLLFVARGLLVFGFDCESLHLFTFRREYSVSAYGRLLKRLDVVMRATNSAKALLSSNQEPRGLFNLFELYHTMQSMPGQGPGRLFDERSIVSNRPGTSPAACISNIHREWGAVSIRTTTAPSPDS